MICGICILILLLLSPMVLGWWGKAGKSIYGITISGSIPNFNDDHKELTDQALDMIDTNDTLNQYRELYHWWQGYQDEISDGANSLDNEELNNELQPINITDYDSFSAAHFYNPISGQAYNSSWKSAKDEAIDWFDDAINTYTRNREEAYEKLGYMIHLLEDMAVPAHTNLIMHSDQPFDYLEATVDADEIKDLTEGLSPIIVSSKITRSKSDNMNEAIKEQFDELAKYSHINNPYDSNMRAIINNYYVEGSYKSNVKVQCPIGMEKY